MVRIPEYSTPETEELCKKIAKKSKGVCLLLFSRGKDSLYSYLQLRKYFKKIIPIHCASVPGMKHVKDTLDYYESILTTIDGTPVRILRMVGEEVPMALARGMYQTPDMLDGLEDLEVDDFSKLDILEVVRKELGLPRCWCAVGINACDSIDRRIYCKKYHGMNKNNLTFYPCWDHCKADIILALQECGVQLSGEYRWTSRSMGGVPSATFGKIWREHYPEDYETYLSIYPLAFAKEMRERYLNRKWEERRAAGIVEDEVSQEEGEFDDGTDVMPELGMGSDGANE